MHNTSKCLESKVKLLWLMMAGMFLGMPIVCNQLIKGKSDSIKLTPSTMKFQY